MDLGSAIITCQIAVCFDRTLCSDLVHWLLFVPYLKAQRCLKKFAGTPDPVSILEVHPSFLKSSRKNRENEYASVLSLIKPTVLYIHK